MRNLVSAALTWAGQPQITLRGAVKMGIKLYAVAAMLMFLIGFFSTLYQGLV